MPGMGWTALLNTPLPAAAGTALANSTTLTDISPTPNYTLPANFNVAGTSLTFRAWGVFSTTATPTLLLGIYWGGVAGVALAATTAFTTPSGVTNVPWRIELDTVIRAPGSAGTAMSQGFVQYGSSVSALQATLPLPQIALATVSVDTTTSKILTVGAQWGTANASNTITCHGFKIFSDAL